MKLYFSSLSGFQIGLWLGWLDTTQLIHNVIFIQEVTRNDISMIVWQRWFKAGWSRNWKKTVFLMAYDYHIQTDSIWPLPTDAQPTEAETAVYNQVSAVLEEAHGILAELQSYNGAGQEIREVWLWFSHFLQKIFLLLNFAKHVAKWWRSLDGC